MAYLSPLGKHLTCFYLFSLPFMEKESHEGIPGSPVVETPCFHCRGCGFDPCSWGTKIL